MRLYSLIPKNQVDVQSIIDELREEIHMERRLRDAHKLIGNQREYLNSELRIATAELLLNRLRFGVDPL